MKKNILMAASIALAMLCACNPLETEQLRDIRFVTSPHAMTKSPIDGTTLPNDYNLVVSSYRNLGDHAGSSDAAGNYFTNVTFSKQVSHWTESRYWPLDGTLDFLAYATAGLKNPNVGVVPTAVWGDQGGNVAKKVVLTVPDNSTLFDDILFGASNGQAYDAEGTVLTLCHAETVVCFAAKANVAYDETNNRGVTINSITLDGAYYSGSLTIENPGAGGGSGNLSSNWSSLGSQKAHIPARVYGGAPCAANEPALADLHLGTSATTFNEKHFGEAYVILPPQAAVSFTIHYTVHNGKAGDTPINSTMEYTYSCSGNWAQGTKNLYTIEITLNEIVITPTVTDWEPGTATTVQI